VLDSGRHLLDLINSILDATRLELGCDQPELEPIETRSFLQSVTSQMQAIAGARGLTIDCQLVDDVVLSADPRLLRQVLFNLIGNAIKFAPARTVVEVAGASTRDGGYQFVVSDAGPGIGAELRTRALLPFQQGDDRLERQHEGLGLGLYIVNRIVDAHGGRVTLDTGPMGGAQVAATLPPACILSR
jgi:cell cycle sensor histidine kinase DivJ